MGLRSWLRSLRKREGETDFERAEDMPLDSPEEREIFAGDIEGVQADEVAGLTWGETPADADRMAEADDE